jgi:hypothetical protein
LLASHNLSQVCSPSIACETCITLAVLHAVLCSFQVHEDQQIDHSLAQLQQDVQEQLQQHQFSSSAEQRADDSGDLSAPMHTAADDSSSSAAAVTEDAAAAADEAAPTAAEPAAAAAADVPASTLMTASKPASSCGDDYEWHLVSPNGSVRLRGGSTSSRTSFDYTGCGVSPRIGSDADAAEAAAGMLADDSVEGLTVKSCCSGSDTETSHTPKDDLAACILGHSVLMRGSHFGSATASEDAAAAAGEEMQGSDDGMEALRAASMLSSEGGLDGLAAAEAAPAGAEDSLTTSAAAKDGAGQQQGVGGGAVDAEVLTGLGLLGGEVAQLVGSAQGKAAMTLQGLREWLMESLAALVQVRSQ